MRRWAPDLAISPDLESAVMRALAKNPDARYDDCNAFARALREAVASGGVAVRSAVPTSAMTSFVAPAPARQSAPALSEAATVSVAAASSSPSAVPISAVESSGVARVRTVTRGDGGEADRSGARAIPANGTHGASGTAQGVAPNLPPRMELPVVSPDAITGPVPPLSQVPDAPPARPPTPYGSDDEFPVVPTGGSAGRTLALVLASVLVTIALATAGAWGMRMFPSQRREDDIASLLRRANEALRLGRYTHASTGNDVEDLTDAVLALDPRNARAPEIRRNAATRLKAASDTERVAGHPDRAVELLREALRLLDDPTLRDELAAAQREVEAQRNAASAPAPRATPRPAPRPAPRTTAPREDPSLVHPVQPVQPLNPPVTPAPHAVRPRRDGGQVITGPTPPDDMSVLPPPSPRARRARCSATRPRWSRWSRSRPTQRPPTPAPFERDQPRASRGA